jgi:hypothetical protein
VFWQQKCHPESASPTSVHPINHQYSQLYNLFGNIKGLSPSHTVTQINIQQNRNDKILTIMLVVPVDVEHGTLQMEDNGNPN